MSAGDFTRAKIRFGDGLVLRARIQPETEQATIATVSNTRPTEPLVADAWTHNLRQSRRSFGIHAPEITVELTADGTGDYGEYKQGSTHNIPCLTPEFYAAAQLDATGTYLGIPCIVIGRKPETRT